MGKMKSVFAIILLVVLGGCTLSVPATGAARLPLAPTNMVTPVLPGEASRIPQFDHIVVIMFENHNYEQVIGSDAMPIFNRLAKQNVLLTNYHAVTHPSLPNYIALIGGDTYGIDSDCTDCFLNTPSLPDLIEASGRTWKNYQEDMPSPCFLGNAKNYRQRHNPFVYFDPIRENKKRCENSIVAFDQLEKDLAARRLPDFAFIMPNMCHSAHDCKLTVADAWLDSMINKLQQSSALGQRYLIVVAFEEGSDDSTSCCGLSAKAGGKVAALLISPQEKSGFEDNTPLSHYSLLKTILISWKLPSLGNSAKQETQAITAPWK
jgi:phosphatidylinositol-3-phosphatase